MTWNDLAPGRSWDSERRCITASDIRDFAVLSGDHNALHADESAARAAGFGGIIAPGALGVAVGTGLVSGLGLTRHSLIAMLALRWTFRAPVYGGDVLTARVSVSSRRRTSRDDRGVVTFALELVNQDGTVVQQGELVELVRTRSSLPQLERI